MEVGRSSTHKFNYCVYNQCNKYELFMHVILMKKYHLGVTIN